jgi:hypothetical protein
VVAEELGERRGLGHFVVLESLTSNEVRPGGISGESRVEQASIGREHAVLDRQGDLVGIRGQIQRIPWLTRVDVIPHEVEAGHPGVDVQPGDSQRVIVVPEGPGGNVVLVPEVCGEAPGNAVPLGADDSPAWAIEELGIAIELEVRMTAVEMRDDGHPAILDAVLLVAVQAVGPVQARVDGQQVVVREIVLPADHGLAFIATDLEGAAGPRHGLGITPVLVAEDKGLAQPPAGIDEARALAAFRDGDLVATLLVGLVDESRRQRIGHDVLELGLARRVTEPSRKSLGPARTRPDRKRRARARHRAQLHEIPSCQVHWLSPPAVVCAAGPAHSFR